MRNMKFKTRLRNKIQRGCIWSSLYLGKLQFCGSFLVSVFYLLCICMYLFLFDLCACVCLWVSYVCVWGSLRLYLGLWERPLASAWRAALHGTHSLPHPSLNHTLPHRPPLPRPPPPLLLLYCYCYVCWWEASPRVSHYRLWKQQDCFAYEALFAPQLPACLGGACPSSSAPFFRTLFSRAPSFSSNPCDKRDICNIHWFAYIQVWFLPTSCLGGAGCPIRQPGPLFVAKLFNADNPQILTKAVLSNVRPPPPYVPLIEHHFTCVLPIKLCWPKFKTGVIIISFLANFHFG